MAGFRGDHPMTLLAYGTLLGGLLPEKYLGSVANFHSGRVEAGEPDQVIPTVNGTVALDTVRLSAATAPSESCASAQSRQASQRLTRRI
jgi:hypothetical protein